MASTEVELRSTIGGFTATGRLHTLSVWFIFALRLMMGIAFFQSGFGKVLAGNFSAAGYLNNAPAANGSPVAGLFEAMGSSALFVDFVNVAVPWGEVLIGLGLIFGALTRLAAFWGAFMMLLFYLGNWDVAHGYINGDFAYMLVFLSVAAFGAGRILGIDAYLEQYDVGGQPLVERYPWMRYILG
ncbi:thiosulfate dehydrogenase [quinone] large subunit [Natronoarchaeum philippinense]|uniref:Thiosulfate dehydrogenase [quinone] large subunit n=1 Tax=Natronoarchaeum philippinense TaxID=558529 RepID=A0A285NT55_NATPI|nr:DoxX family protein [Natronoarchaeum philippinense]SNZ12645.1 thiosulfate dehydrogenase [quinone] large subunit [Natronoarchaeum philippinense]